VGAIDGVRTDLGIVNGAGVGMPTIVLADGTAGKVLNNLGVGKPREGGVGGGVEKPTIMVAEGAVARALDDGVVFGGGVGTLNGLGVGETDGAVGGGAGVNDGSDAGESSDCVAVDGGGACVNNGSDAGESSD
jgi:hypothetical protein